MPLERLERLDRRYFYYGKPAAKIVDRFRSTAKGLCGCTCGWAEPDRITSDCSYHYYHYSSPINALIGRVIPTSRSCRCRQIEHALIRAYRSGRSGGGRS